MTQKAELRLQHSYIQFIPRPIPVTSNRYSPKKQSQINQSLYLLGNALSLFQSSHSPDDLGHLSDDTWLKYRFLFKCYLDLYLCTSQVDLSELLFLCLFQDSCWLSTYSPLHTQCLMLLTEYEKHRPLRMILKARTLPLLTKINSGNENREERNAYKIT